MALAVLRTDSSAQVKGWDLLAPYLFVVLWSTGFIGARYGLPYAEPFTLLFLRFALTLVVLLISIALTRARWPESRLQVFHICVVGLLSQAGYLGGNYIAMAKAMPLGLVALVGGLQPLLTAILVGTILKEKVSARAWIGLVLGLAGVVLVLFPKIGTDGVTAAGIAGVTIGLFALTGATIYQKKYCPHAPLQTSMALQLMTALAVVGPIAYAFETRLVVWSPSLIFAILWLAIVLSLGAMTVFWLLVRRGEANKVASVFYLTPAVTALMAYVLFHEHMSAMSIAGMVVAASGVALVTAKAKAA